MSDSPTLIFIHGAWHKPTCYVKVTKLLQENHNLKCISITLPSTTGNPASTFKDDVDVAREAISNETTIGRDVIIIAHSYGGIVGNSAIKGFAQPRDTVANGSTLTDQSQTPASGHVIGLILIASGFNLTGLSFMDPMFGHPPPSWRVNKETGCADIVASPQQLFYGDLPADEADYWVSQLTTQSLKSLFEGAEFAYAGWMDVPAWYIGTVEDQGLPVAMQRITVGMARAMGASVEHRELQSSHSPFLSQPEETVQIMLEAVGAFTGKAVENQLIISERDKKIVTPSARLWEPLTWYRFGLPLVFGHIMGRSYRMFTWGRMLWRSTFS